MAIGIQKVKGGPGGGDKEEIEVLRDSLKISKIMKRVERVLVSEITQISPLPNIFPPESRILPLAR